MACPGRPLAPGPARAGRYRWMPLLPMGLPAALNSGMLLDRGRPGQRVPQLTPLGVLVLSGLVMLWGPWRLPGSSRPEVLPGPRVRPKPLGVLMPVVLLGAPR